MAKSDDLNGLRQKLDLATERYEMAQAKARQARIDETTALNNLNAAQRDIQRALDELRDAAPDGSDWKRRHRREEIHVE